MSYLRPRAFATTALRRIRHPLPAPRPHYPPREPGYVEAAELSREMTHL